MKVSFNNKTYSFKNKISDNTKEFDPKKERRKEILRDFLAIGMLDCAVLSYIPKKEEPVKETAKKVVKNNKLYKYSNILSKVTFAGFAVLTSYLIFDAYKQHYQKVKGTKGNK